MIILQSTCYYMIIKSHSPILKRKTGDIQKWHWRIYQTIGEPILSAVHINGFSFSLVIFCCNAVLEQTFKIDWYTRTVNITVDWHLWLVLVSAHIFNTYRYNNIIVSPTHLHEKYKAESDVYNFFFIYFYIRYKNNKNEYVDFGLVG